MATLKNTRNILLNSAATRIEGATLTITTGGVGAITVASGATVPSPGSITLTAVTALYSAPTYLWEFRFGDTGTWSTISGATTNATTITLDAAWLTSAGTNVLVQYRVTVTQTGVNTSTVILSLPIIKSGTIGISPIAIGYSNDSLTVPVSQAGVATWASSGGLLQIYEGTTPLKLNSAVTGSVAPATNGEYVINIGKISGDTLTTPSISGANTTTTSIGDWAGTLTTATVYRITAYVKSSYGTNVTTFVDVTISPSKAGADSTIYYIATSSPVITKEAPDATTSGVHSSLTIQGKRSVGSVVTNYGWVTVTPNGGTEAITATDTSTTPITLTPGNGDGKTSYTIKMYNGATVAGAVLLDTEVVNVVFKGATGASGTGAVFLAYSNDSLTVPLTTAGVANWTGSGGTLQVYEGTTLLTLNSTIQSTTHPTTPGRYVLDITYRSGDSGLTEPTLSGTDTITLDTWGGILTTATVYRITAYVKTVSGSNITVFTDVSISPSRAGADSTIYYIATSSPVITKEAPDATTAGTHSTLTIQGKQTIGGTTTNYGWVTVTANGVTEATTATNTAITPVTLTPGNADGKISYTIKMYNQATVSGATLLDTEVVNVVFKGTAGTPGANAFTVAYTNDSLTVPLNTAGVATWTGSGGTLQVYEGSTLLSLDNTVQSTSYPTANSKYVLDITYVSGDTLTEPGLAGNPFSGVSTITIPAWSGTLTTATVYRITAYIRSSTGTILSISRDISISPSKAGSDGQAYWLTTSAPAVQKSIAGVYTPSTVTYNIKNSSGTTAPADYAGRFIIATSTDGTTYTTAYPSAANESSYTYTVPANIKTIRVRAYLAGGTITLLDELITTVVSDGANGTNTATIDLYNKNTSSTVPPTAFVGPFNYTFSTSTLALGTGANLNGWTRSAPAITNGEYLWIRSATVSSSSDTITGITAAQFSAATINSIGGINGTNGQTARRAYTVTTSGTAPIGITAGTGDVVPASPGTWTFTIPATVADGEYMYQSDGLYNPTTNTTTWSSAYLSNFKVGNLSAITANTGNLTIGTTGSIRSSGTSYGGTGIFLGYDTNAYKFSVGNSGDGARLSFDGNTLTIPVFSAIYKWDFANIYATTSANFLGWGSSNITASVLPNSIRLDSQNSDPIIISPDALNFSGATYNKVLVRVKRLAGTTFDGALYYGTNSGTGYTGHPISASYYKGTPDRTILNQWVTLEWDMTSLTVGGSDWINATTIRQIRIDLGNSASDQFEIDWIAIGKYSSGTPDIITPSNISSFIDSGAVKSGQLGLESATVARTTTSTTTYSGVGQILTYSFSMPEGGQIIAFWQASADSARNYRFTMYLNSDPSNVVPASYQFVGYPNGDYELYDDGMGNVAYYYVGTGGGSYLYVPASSTANIMGTVRTGNAFEDAPFILGIGTGIAGTNTIKVYWETHGGGSITGGTSTNPGQKLVVLGAKR